MGDIKRALAVAALLSMMAVAVTQAATLLETTASSPTYGVTNSDSGPPPSLVESILDYTSESGNNFLQAHAAADTSGASAVSASAVLVDGGSGPFRAFASAKITQVAVNDSGTPLDYQFHFTLSGPNLQIHNSLGAAAFYDAEIKLNGVEIWSSTATLIGAYFGNYSLSQSGVDLGATLIDAGLNKGYVFGNYSNTLALGTFQAGDTVTVEAELQVWFEAPAYELYGSAEIGDPNDLTGGSGFGGSLDVVPEPAVGHYVVLGLGCLILVTRRFHKRVNSQRLSS